MTREDVEKLDKNATVYINDLLELLEVYNKYMEKVNQIYSSFKEVKIVPSTSSI
ncbi:hypothetical protein [Saccharolobus shibatae]|nr:hypothetical protein [Saccharolobus shibatae]QXJ34861.1 hypothetical protein J5U22_01408 [Saccharolobus shibatae]